MKKSTIIFILITLFCVQLFAQKRERGLAIDTRRIMEGMPVVGEIVRDAEGEKDDRYHVHDAGVYYENVTQDLFMNIDYKMQEGSLKANLINLAKKYGWKVIWNLDTDYDIPVGFLLKNRRMPEIFAEAIFHLPIKITFYSKNKVVFVQPMYDKRETDVGHKYSINPRG